MHLFETKSTAKTFQNIGTSYMCGARKLKNNAKCKWLKSDQMECRNRETLIFGVFCFTNVACNWKSRMKLRYQTINIPLTIIRTQLKLNPPDGFCCDNEHLKLEDLHTPLHISESVTATVSAPESFWERFWCKTQYFCQWTEIKRSCWKNT